MGWEIEVTDEAEQWLMSLDRAEAKLDCGRNRHAFDGRTDARSSDGRFDQGFPPPNMKELRSVGGNLRALFYDAYLDEIEKEGLI